MLATLMMEACILPPERDLVLDENVPPQVDLGSLLPSAPIYEIGPECEAFFVEAGRIRDRDNERVLVRFVANNKTPQVRFLNDIVRDTPGASPRGVGLRVVPVQDFREQFAAIREPGLPGCPATTRTAVLSMFVTDADAWANTDPNANEIDDPDLSKIAPPREDRPAPHVVEVRWVFRFDSTAPRCLQ